MLTQTSIRRYPQWLILGIRIGLFVGLIALSAKIRLIIPGTPVPITMQTLAVLLAGMVLGPVQGAASVIAYLGAIAAGMPLDTAGLGTAALVGPTAGYLVGFVPAAFIAGLAWRAQGWRRFTRSFALGLVAIAVLFTFGVIGLLPYTRGSWTAAFMAGAVPFIFVDFGKALLAASLVKLGHESWLRWIAPNFTGSDRI